MRHMCRRGECIDSLCIVMKKCEIGLVFWLWTTYNDIMRDCVIGPVDISDTDENRKERWRGLYHHEEHHFKQI